MDYDLALLIVALAVLFLSFGLMSGAGPSVPLGATTPAPGPENGTASATVSPRLTPTPDPTSSATTSRTPTAPPTAPPPTSTSTEATTPTPTPVPNGSPTTAPAPSPTAAEGWPRAEFRYECDSKRSADIYYRVEVLGTKRVTELYGADNWESNSPRTFAVSGTETHERSMSVRGGRWIELYTGKNTNGDPFARYYVEEDACRDYSRGE